MIKELLFWRLHPVPLYSFSILAHKHSDYRGKSLIPLGLIGSLNQVLRERVSTRASWNQLKPLGAQQHKNKKK